MRLLILSLLFMASCQRDCEGEVEWCLHTEVTQQTTLFEIPYPMTPGRYYYLSFYEESQGRVNVQFNPTGSMVFPYDLPCHPYGLFVFRTDSISYVHQEIQDFYNGIDTTMVYYCEGITKCD